MGRCWSAGETAVRRIAQLPDFARATRRLGWVERRFSTWPASGYGLRGIE